MTKYVKAGILVLLSLLLAAGGTVLILRHRSRDRDRWNFGDMEEYLSQRGQLDSERARLENEILQRERSLVGTVVLMFDQCTPNAYDIIYAQLSEFEMVGSLVFCDKVPGDEGAISPEQWQEMEKNGWSSVLATDTELLVGTLGTRAYAETIAAYAEQQKKKFADLGFAVPTAYSFAEGECTEDTLKALYEIGFTVFTAPDATTGILYEDCALFGQAYLASGPNVPLIQGKVDRVKNEADAIVIKTRYVHETEDLSFDTDLAKFRMGMLTTLSGYRNAESITVKSLEKGLASYLTQCQSKKKTDLEILDLEEQIRVIEDRLAALWTQYRS